jgi:hypothetical protein
VRIVEKYCKVPVMSEKRTKRGRPPSPSPKAIQLNVRVDAPIRSGVEAYRKKHGFDDLSDAARDILKTVLRKEGLLK